MGASLDKQVFEKVPTGKILVAANLTEDPHKPFTQSAFKIIIKTMLSKKKKRELLRGGTNAQ